MWPETPQNYGLRFREEFANQVSRTSIAVRRTSGHIPLLTVQVQIAGRELEAVVDAVVSDSVARKCLAFKVEIWKRSGKVHGRLSNIDFLGGNFVVYTWFKLFDNSSVMGMFAIDVKFGYIGNWNLSMPLLWLTGNWFWVDTQDTCQRNVNAGQVILCSVRWISELFILEEKQLADGEILRIMDAREQYYHYVQGCSVMHAVRVLDHMLPDQEILLRQPNTKIPRGAIYKTTWEKNEVVWK